MGLQYNGKLVGVFLFCLIAFATSASAKECVYDDQCDGTDWCDEFNASAYGKGQCSDIKTTACNGTDISCTTNLDCRYEGSETCTARGICEGQSSAGGVCRLDKDCPYGYICRLDVCTQLVYNGELYLDSCSSNYDDSTCLETQTCVDKICRNKADLGADCNKDADCLSNQCHDSYNVCVECEDGITEAPEGYFCNVQAEQICNSVTLYETKATENDYPVPVYSLLLNEGDTCYEDGCCATGLTCDGTTKKCVWAGTESYTGNLTAVNNFCELGIDLTTSWFDGISTNESTPPNLTIFNTVFNKSDLRIVMAWNHTHADDGYSLWYRDASQVLAGYYIMTLTAYDVGSDELCYFKQADNNIFFKCVDASSLTPILHNSTHVIINESFAITNPEDDFTIISSGEYYYSGQPAYQRTMWAYVFKQTSTSIYVDGVSFYRHSGGIFATYLRIANRLGTVVQTSANPIFYNNALPAGASIGSFGIAPSENRDNDQDRYALAHGVGIPYGTGSTMGGVKVDIPTYTSWGISYLSTPPTPLNGVWWPIQNGYSEMEQVSCCESDADCGGLCCENSQCVPCPVKKAPTIGFVPISDKLNVRPITLCVNETVTFDIKLYDGNNEIYPEGAVWITNDGNGNINPAYKSASSSLKRFTYTSASANEVDNISISFDSTDEDYDDSKYPKLPITVTTNCHYGRFQIISSATKNPVEGVIMTTPNKDYKSDKNGKIPVSGLTGASFTTTLSKSGYTTVSYLIEEADLDTNYYVQLEISPGNTSGIPATQLDNYAWEAEIPEDSQEALRGMKNLTLTFIGIPFQWILLFILFLLAIGVTKLLVESVT